MAALRKFGGIMGLLNPVVGKQKENQPSETLHQMRLQESYGPFIST